MTRHYQFADVVAPSSPCCPSPELSFPAATPFLRPGSWESLSERWHSASAVAVPFSALLARNAFDVRFSDVAAAPIPNGGRHFSSVDPSTHLDRKLHRVFHTEWSGERATFPPHLARCRAHGVHHRGWWFAEPPVGAMPDDVARLVDKLGASPRAPLRRRRLVRTWAWLRLHRWLPDRAVAAIDTHFERWLPLLAVPLAIAETVRYALASITIKPRRDISATNDPTSASHVERSTA